jgi:hypothetical protein
MASKIGDEGSVLDRLKRMSPCSDLGAYLIAPRGDTSGRVQ